jgi:tetratricopeptide (TPR) repeat protein
MLKTLLSMAIAFLFWSGSEAANSKHPLNQALVKKYYGDGDFDPAIAILEDFQKTNATFSREESLMVYKYLGVMYCADQGSREKGKSYFYKLLKIEPEAKILDMYVSIVVQDIFKGTLDELMGQSGFGSSNNHAPTSGSENKLEQGAFPAPKPNDKTASQEKGVRKTNTNAFWWAGGVALAAGVAGGYYLYASSSETVTGPETDILIPLQ